MQQYYSEIMAVAKRILTEHARMRRSLIFWVVFPVLMLLLFGMIYAGRDTITEKSFDSTPPGILIGAALFFSCMGGTVSLIVAERERRTLRRLLISPLRPISYFIGIVAAFMVIALGQTIIVYGLAFLFGGRFYGSVLLGLLILVLSVFSYVGMGFFFGARFAKRTEDVNGPIAAFGVPLLVLAGTFFPIDLLPPYLYDFAHLNPIFHMIQALRAVAVKGKGVEDISLNLIFLGVFAILSLIIGAQSYKKMLLSEKRA